MADVHTTARRVADVRTMARRVADVRTMSVAARLPDSWDLAAGDNLFLTRAALTVLEETNPCQQRYHLVGDGGDASIAVTYAHRLNLLSFGRGSLRVPLTIVGIPCSVAWPGYRFQPATEAALAHHLHQLPGITLVLNADPETPFTGFGHGTTLPSCVLRVRWESFDDYLAAQRSPYRYRLRKAMARWRPVRATTLTRTDLFDAELYQLYCQVFHRSDYKLEQLPQSFFQRFPAEITRFDADGQAIGFVQLVHHARETIFLFGGMDYATARGYDTYLNLLLHIVRRGLEEGAARINLGQTAEESKRKLGADYAARALHAAHPNRVWNRLLQGLARPLSYRPPDHCYHVFRD